MRKLRIILSITERDIRRSRHLRLYVFTVIRPLIFAMFTYFLGLLVGTVVINGLVIPYYKYGLIGASITTLFFASLQAGVYLQYERAILFEDELKTLPVSWKILMVGRLLSFVVIAFLSLVAYSTVVAFAIGFEVVPYMLLVGVLLSFMLIPMMIVISDRCKDITVYNFIANILEFLAIFLSTTFLPIDAFPEFIRSVVMLNPLSVAMNLFLVASFGVPEIGHLIAIVVYISILAVIVNVLSVNIFARVRK